MKRNVFVGVLLAALFAALGIGQGWLERRADAQASNGTKIQVPRFEVDPTFPKPLPNGWYQGMSIGVGVDANRHPLVPAVRQRLREGRVDLEARHLDLRAVRGL